ncbi:NAD(P)-dependent alcohol dehydrogenase [Flindersiella endophytica]
MKAIVQDRYGSPATLELKEVGKPTPAGNEVLVRVHAASVNAYDWHFMRGDPLLARLMMGSLSKPKQPIRGRDFAGTVVEAGAGVTRLRPGDEVYGDSFHANGAFAEYVCVPESMVAPKPANLSFEQAAAVPLAANTALMGLRDLAEVRPGQCVLINGASGGVGTFAVQLAKAYGADVTAVCSTRNLDLVKSLGADHLIDYTQDDFTLDKQRYDVVFDLVANRRLRDLRGCLSPAGTLLLSGGGVFDGGSLVGPMGLVMQAQLLARFARQRLLVLSEQPSSANLSVLRELIEAGDVKPVIDRTYSLAEVPKAIEYVETEHARAKVVIAVIPS